MKEGFAILVVASVAILSLSAPKNFLWLGSTGAAVFHALNLFLGGTILLLDGGISKSWMPYLYAFGVLWYCAMLVAVFFFPQEYNLRGVVFGGQRIPDRLEDKEGHDDPGRAD